MRVLKLGRDTLALDGDFSVDEGLIDFSRSDAPRLSDDVHVRRGEATDADFTLTAAAKPMPPLPPPRRRKATLNLRVQLGEKLRVRGQGLDTGLRGELRLTAPQGRLRVDGSVRTVGGTYRAYRQRLDIDRGVLTFNGPIENPQLDIEAIRPNLDVRVGVAVTGTVLVPRVRLFSEPEMSDADKLSWLLRGRASEGQGSGDTALLQARGDGAAGRRRAERARRAVQPLRPGRPVGAPERQRRPAAPSSRSASSCRATGTWATSAA